MPQPLGFYLKALINDSTALVDFAWSPQELYVARSAETFPLGGTAASMKGLTPARGYRELPRPRRVWIRHHIRRRNG